MGKKAIFTNSWNNYLEYFGEEKKDIYFTEEYVKLYESNKDIAECFVYKDSDKVLLLPYLKRKIGILNEDFFDFETAYGYGGPIANIHDSVFVQEAWEELKIFARKNKIVAGFIRFHPLLDNYLLLADKTEIIFDRETVAMPLDFELDKIWEQIHPNHRNSIRKSQGFGLNYIVDEKLEYLDLFKKIYKFTMNRLDSGAFYYFNEDYFSRLGNLKKQIFLGLVSFNEKIISAAIFFKYGIYGHAHLAGSLEGYRCYSPNDYLYYMTALFLKDKGVKLFHLGGGTDNNKNNSLYKFKKGFSDNERSFYIGKLIFDSKVYNEICNLWENNFSKGKENYKNKVLKYRYQ